MLQMKNPQSMQRSRCACIGNLIVEQPSDYLINDLIDD